MVDRLLQTGVVQPAERLEEDANWLRMSQEELAGKQRNQRFNWYVEKR